MIKRFEVAHPSMTPTLSPGDYLLARRTHRPPRRGEVIVFEQPDIGFVIKRIVALGGETIRATDGTVFVDDNSDVDRWAVGLTAAFEPHRVPDGQVWVMGDRRELSSSDSRTIGPIDATRWWRAMFRYFPIRSAGAVR